MSMVDTLISKSGYILKLQNIRGDLLKKFFFVNNYIAYNGIARVQFLTWSIGQMFPDNKIKRLVSQSYCDNITFCNLEFVLVAWCVWCNYDNIKGNEVTSDLRKLVMGRGVDKEKRKPLLVSKSNNRFGASYFIP